MSRFHFPHKNGFTLVELLIVLIILGIVFAIVSILFYLPLRSSEFSRQHYIAFEEMRKVLEVLRKELVLAKDAEATDTSLDQLKLTPGQIAFYYWEGKFYLKTPAREKPFELADLNLSLDEPLFEVVTSQSNPRPKPKKYVKVYLVHKNPDIELETSIGLLNSFQLTSVATSTGNILIVTK